MEAAELNVSYTTIVASMDGVVTKKSVEVGQIIQPGQGLMTIIPLHDVWVTANFKETQLAAVHPGQKAEVHVDRARVRGRGHRQHLHRGQRLPEALQLLRRREAPAD